MLHEAIQKRPQIPINKIDIVINIATRPDNDEKQNIFSLPILQSIQKVVN